MISTLGVRLREIKIIISKTRRARKYDTWDQKLIKK